MRSLSFQRTMLTGLSTCLGGLLSVSCVQKVDNDSSAGQTGSLVVAPDYETPVPYRPPSPGPNNTGPSPERPHRLLSIPTRLASFGNGSRQAVATPRGLGIFSVSNQGQSNVVASLLQGVIPLWVATTDDQLLVMASGGKGELQLEAQLQTRFYAYQQARLEGPQVLDVPGRFIQAKRQGDRVMILSQEPAPASCLPGVGPRLGFPASVMLVTELQLEAGGWGLVHTVRVQAHGYVETESAYVLTTETSYGKVGKLTVVELEEAGVKQWPPLDLDSKLPETASGVGFGPMAVANGKLAMLVLVNQLWELRVLPLDVALDESSSPPLAFQVSEAIEGSSTLQTRAFFLGNVVVLPGTAVTDETPIRDSGDNTQNAHTVVNWNAEGGAVVVAPLPEDIVSVLPMGNRLLALGTNRSLVFAFGAEGQLQQEHELAASPAAGRHLYQLHFDASRQQALLPYRAPSAGAVTERESVSVAILTGLSGQADWSTGTQLGGGPGRLERSWASKWTNVQPVGNDDWWLLDRAGDYELSSRHWSLQSFSLGDTASLPIGFLRQPLGTRLTGVGPVTLSVDIQGRRSVQLDNDNSVSLDLQYGESRLALGGPGAVAYEHQSSNACGEELLEASDDGGPQCLDIGRAAVATIDLSSPASLLQEVRLPYFESAEYDLGRVNFEWVEAVVQSEVVALMQHRGVSCQTIADCNTLGIEYEVEQSGGGMLMCPDGDEVCANQMGEPSTRVSGYRNERWLYPFNVDTGQFAEPVSLGTTEPYGWVTAENFVSEAPGLSLTQVYPGNLPESGIGPALTARYELLQWPQGVPSQPPQRTTLPGEVLWVNATHAISLAPAQLPGTEGGSVGATMHYLSLQQDGAHIEQTLELERGHSGHRWAEKNGYVLLTPDDQCATRNLQLVAVGLREGQLEQLGRLDILGTRWQLREATDQLIRLTRTVDNLEQHALVDLGDAGLSFRIVQSAPVGTPISLRGSDVHIAYALP